MKGLKFLLQTFSVQGYIYSMNSFSKILTVILLKMYVG